MELMKACSLRGMASRSLRGGGRVLAGRRIVIARKPQNHRYQSTPSYPSQLEINGETYQTDAHTNVPPSILSNLPRKLHLQPSHPISLTRNLIESLLSAPTYKHYNRLPPVVSVAQNFDSLGFPPMHPGRSPCDTYYVNASTLLRTHTSAHQVDTFRIDASDGYTISADVYRRDAIDRSHYPVFHQMEAARTWDRRKVPQGDVGKAIWTELTSMPKHDLVVEDPSPTVHPQRNPLQAEHALADVEAIAAHLKHSLENVVVEIFGRAQAARAAAGLKAEEREEEPLRVRWVEAYFPFTSPSWELEVLWQGSWLEVLGCGVVQQSLLQRAGVPDRVGWAFGIGLERIAMLLYGIPDIRLFWSKDQRFLEQFKEGRYETFQPFSKYPGSTRDVAFWVKGDVSDVMGKGGMTASDVHENDVMEVVRNKAGDVAEDVRLVDEFTEPATGKRSLCYRIIYRSLERTMTKEEVNTLHESVRKELIDKLRVELR